MHYQEMKLKVLRWYSNIIIEKIQIKDTNFYSDSISWLTLNKFKIY